MARFTYAGSGRAGFAKHDYTGPETLKQPLPIARADAFAFHVRDELRRIGRSVRDDDGAGVAAWTASSLASWRKVGDCVRTHSQVETVRLTGAGRRRHLQAQG